jgi:glycosyltransferase involved in cell wall biosynthesis
LENLSRELGIEDLVHFTGFVEQERLVEYFRDCTLFVLPAIYDRRGDTEGQGVVIVEAMSFGKPVVASKVGGIVDVVRDGETGILVEEKDEKALAEAIFALLEDPSLAREMGDRGYRLYRELYGWESISVRWSSLYERVMGGDG